MDSIAIALKKYRISRLRELAERTRHAEAILRRIDVDSGLFEDDATRFYKRSAIGGLELDLDGVKNQVQDKLDELVHECRLMEVGA